LNEPPRSPRRSRTKAGRHRKRHRRRSHPLRSTRHPPRMKSLIETPKSTFINPWTQSPLQKSTVHVPLHDLTHNHIVGRAPHDIGDRTFESSHIEGKPNLPHWRKWCEEHEPTLERSFARGRFLRLKYHPMTEIPRILEECGIKFVRSEEYEWIDDDSKSGRCRYCGSPVRRERHGDSWTWCPNGCFYLETHTPPPRR